MIRGFTSLRMRLMAYLLLPVAALLVGLGVAGFIFARDNLLDQLRQSALLSLQRAAHAIDMRLEQPVQVVRLLNSLEGLNSSTMEDWKQHLAAVPGVARVELSWIGPEPGAMGSTPGPGPGMGRGPGRGRSMGMGRHMIKLAQVTAPRFDPVADQKTVSLIFDLNDQDGEPLGRLTVVLRFNYLLEALKPFRRWKADRAYLVDSTGMVLAQGGAAPQRRQRLGETGDAFEVQVLQEALTKKSGTALGPGHPAEVVAGFQRLEQAPWTIVLFAPGQEVLAPVTKFLRVYVFVGLLCIAVVLLLIFAITSNVAASVRRVCQAASLVATGDYQAVTVPRSNDEFFRLANSFNTMVAGLKEKDFIRNTFGRYVDQEVARQLLSGPEASRLGGDKRSVAIMMTDVRGFTPLAERLSPEETINVINRYLSNLIEVIQGHKGIIVDFLGDSILVFFDSQQEGVAEAAHRSVCCALDLKEATQAFNQAERDRGNPELETGIGLHAGEVVVGNIGSATRTKYGIVGGPVNMTHRIQAQAEGGEIIVSQAVMDLLGEVIAVGRSFHASLKGIEGEVELFSLEGIRDCETDEAPGEPI